MPQLQFNHFHSFIFSSKTDIPWIVRTGWAGFLGNTHQVIKSVPTFIWKQFHRLADIVRFWFQIHDMPFEYMALHPQTQQYIRIMFFPTVMSRLCAILRVCEMPGISRITVNELESLPILPYSEINVDAIIDPENVNWIFDMFVDNRSYFFGDYFDSSSANLDDYKRRSTKMRDEMQKCFDAEHLDADVYLQNFYRTNGFPTWPITYAMALDLAGPRAKNSSRVVRFAKDVINIEPEDGISRAIKFKALRDVCRENRKRKNVSESESVSSSSQECEKRLRM